MIQFPKALKLQLREESTKQIIQDVKLPEHWQHAPLAITAELYEFLGKWKRDGYIDGDELRVIDAELLRFMDICGGCERIQKTRIIRSYRLFARQCVILFLLTLPWGIAKEFGWWTVPLTALTAYFMFGMEIVAEHVEEPFGYDDDDLDLESMCRTIGRSVSEIFTGRVEDNP